MDSLINRYRNITVLLLVILGQLVLIAVQVRNDQDVRLIRVWSVTAVTPLARMLEGIRSGTVGFVNNYFFLRNADQENRQLKAELGKLKMENVFLKAELATAERAKALMAFQARTPSRTLPSRVIGTGTGGGTSSKAVFIDTGSRAGVERGMGVVTPDGIVGKVIAAYPTASLVMLITDPDFAAGVISRDGHIHGTIKGQGYGNCKIDYVSNEAKVHPGDWFYTSGEDRIFPKGFPVGTVRSVKKGPEFQDIVLDPSGTAHGLEELLVIVEGVHQPIAEAPPASAPVYVGPPPPQTAEAPAAVPAAAAGQPGSAAAPAAPGKAKPETDADRLRQRYQRIGEAQNHTFGEGLPGSKPPDFNIALPKPGAPPPAAAPAAGQKSAAGPPSGTARP